MVSMRHSDGKVIFSVKQKTKTKAPGARSLAHLDIFWARLFSGPPSSATRSSEREVLVAPGHFLRVFEVFMFV